MRPDRARRDAALAVLTTADRLLAGWQCPASTECCRFGETGREPYLTAAEWDLVAAEVARQGRKLPVAPADRTCAFLSPEGRCTIYAARPLGCRTYFCERADGPGRPPRAALAALPRRLEDLSRLAGAADGGRGRPLGAWLREHGGARPGRRGPARRRVPAGSRGPGAA